MNNIFGNLGNKSYRAFRIAGGHKDPGSEEFERKQALFAQKLRLLEALPITSDARPKLARQIMEQHQPEIAAMIGPGGYRAYGTEPASYKRLTEAERVKASKIHTGLEPRAESPWKTLQEMAETEANLGLDEMGKPRHPALTEQINKQIAGYKLPGMPTQKMEQLGAGAREWLGEDLGPKFTEPTVPPKKTDIWGGLKKGLKTGLDLYKTGKSLFRRTGEGTPPKTTGKDRRYGIPQKPYKDTFDEVDDLVQSGKAGALSLPGTAYRKKPTLSLPKTGDPEEFKAHRRVLRIYQGAVRKKPGLADLIFQWRKTGMPYTIIERILNLLEQGRSMEIIIGAEDVKPYFKDYLDVLEGKK
jgi:hypothetical protein